MLSGMKKICCQLKGGKTDVNTGRYGWAVFFGLSSALFISGCGVEKTEDNTPEKVTKTYLSYMKEGEYEKAASLAGTAFDAEKETEGSSLQQTTVQAMYSNMEYELKGEKIKDNTASVTVIIKNADYTDIMNNAVFETLEAKKDDAYTMQVFEELLEEAPLQEKEVKVNYRKEDGIWIFDGGNSQLWSAMAGF